MMSRTGKICGISLVLILILISSCSGLDFSKNKKKPSEGIDLVNEAWQVIFEDYVDSQNLDKQELAEAAIKGMVAALNDPYSAYLDPSQTKISSAKFEGDFSGIGVTVTVQDGVLTVVTPIADSPADQAGIKAGDKILGVDGTPTAKMSLMETVLRIRGEKGTKVKLLILHPDEKTPVEIEITRAEIKVPSVRWEMLAENIAHVTITEFSDRTDSEFKSALEDIISQEVNGIVLDLRNNPGGVVNAAVGVVSQFVKNGVVVYAMDNKGKKLEWTAHDGGLALDIPLAVLVNSQSASASEVVAGALQDYERGPIIGTTTFGKGSMNHVDYLSNDGALYLTFARWFTPKGRQIDKKGIPPDIEVQITPDDLENNRDPQLERATEYLMQGE